MKILNGLTPVKLATGASLFSNVPGKVDAVAAELEGLTCLLYTSHPAIAAARANDNNNFLFIM